MLLYLPFKELITITIEEEMLYKWGESHLGLSTRSEEGLVLSAGTTDNRKMLTAVQYKVPVQIETIVMTDSTNIRLYFGSKGRVVFNWEGNPDEVRIHDPRKGYAWIPSARIPINEWAKICWIIGTDHMVIKVNDQEVCKIVGDYAQLSGRVGIGPAWGSQLVVQSFSVTGESRPAKKLAQRSPQLDEQIISDFIDLRNETLHLMESIPSTISDIIPIGFDTNIRYNFGFILVAWDHGIFPKLQKNSWRVPQQYHSMFPRRLRPRDWKEEPPSMEGILEHLRNQRDDIAASCYGQLDVLLKNKQTLRRLLLYFMPIERRHVNIIKEIVAYIN